MKRNPHKSHYALQARRISKAARVEAKGKALVSVGAKRQDAHLMQKGQRLSRRGILSGEGGEQAGGTHTLGPVGRLPNGLFKRAITTHRANQTRKRLETSLEKVRVDIAQLERDIVDYRHSPFWRDTPSAKKWAAQDSLRKQRLQKEETRLQNELKRLPRTNPVVNGIVEAAAGLQALEYLGGKVRGRRKNPSVTQISKTFQGEANGAIDEAYAANAAPKNLARAGKLVFLKVAGRSLRIPGATVAIAPNNKLWITGDHAPLFNTKAKAGEGLDVGEVSHICYETAKRHIENGETVEYIHKFGEEGGRLPHLIIDHEGMPILRGGDYTIRREGIVN